MTTQTTQQKLTRDTIEIPYRHVNTHFIDGAWRESQGQDTIEVTDPATNTVWVGARGNEDDVNAAVEAAHAAFTLPVVKDHPTGAPRSCCASPTRSRNAPPSCR